MGSPVYIQIHNQLRENIENDKWRVGQKIPAERELASQFNVSRMTLRQAIQALVDEGILERRVGSGTFVANRKVQEKMAGVTSFTELKLPAGEQVLRMERVRSGNDVPICYEIATVPAALVKDFSRDEITSSFYRTLEQKAHLYPGHAIQHISATKATDRIATYLDVKRGDPLLRMTQLSSLQDGRPFEYVHTQYVGSRFEFVLEK